MIARSVLRGLMGVNRLLQLIHPEPDRARAFLRGAHPAFDNASPLQLMLAQGCPGIEQMRAYFLAQVRC